MAMKNLVPLSKKEVPAKREEHDPFVALRRDMDSLFDNFFRSFELEPFGGRLGTFAPKIDVTEDDKQIKISAELPGMDEKDIEVSLAKDSLTIKGEKKQEKEEKGKDYYRMERSYGSFSRVIPLPEEIDTNKVDATFKKGVLSIFLPKTAKAVQSRKKIAIKAE